MKIVVGMNLSEAEQKTLCAAAPNCTVEFPGAGQVTAENAADADMVIGNIPHVLVPQLKNLKALQLNSAGNDGYDTAIQQVPGARLFNASGAYGLALSEHMLCGLLMLMKKMHLYLNVQRECRWEPQGMVRSLYGARVLVLGLGDVGTKFAQRVKAMGAYVIGMKRTPGEKPACVDELYTVDKIDEVLPTVDAVCMSLPNTPETTGILSAARIAAMKPGAYVANVGRGSAIDQKALVEALNEGRLGGASLDVTTPEPLPADDPLWTAKNCLITPHIAGGFRMGQTKQYVMEIIEENLRAFANGLPMRNEVDVSRGY